LSGNRAGRKVIGQIYDCTDEAHSAVQLKIIKARLTLPTASKYMRSQAAKCCNGQKKEPANGERLFGQET